MFRWPRAIRFYKISVGRMLAANKKKARKTNNKNLPFDALRVKQSDSFSPGVTWLHRPVSSVVKRTPSVREVWGSIPGPVKSAPCYQRLATVVEFLRSCVTQTLSSGDGLRHSLHASA